jgi:hypothetical protein
MSITPQQSASVRLSAKPSATATGELPLFAVVTRGYDKQQVEEWWRKTREDLERLGRQSVSFLGREAKSPEGQKLISELLQLAADEVTGKQQAAEEEVAQMLTGAQEQSAQILSEARRQAADSNANASQQANTLINGARADAKRITDEAEAYAAAVREAAGARLADIGRIWHDTLDRIDQVHQVTGQTMTAEQQRGPIDDEVTRALAPVIPVMPPRLLALDVLAGAGDPPPGTGVVDQAVVTVFGEPSVHGFPHDGNSFVLQYAHDLEDARAHDPL